MRRYPAILLFIGCMGCWPWIPGQAAEAPAGLVERLQKTEVTNIDAIIEAQFADGGRVGGFTLIDPYGPAAAETVHRWQAQASHDTEVCAIRFTGEERMEYELHGFATPGEAEAAGFTVTHQGRCGSCSTLEDLAVYLSTPDLTTPARACSRRFGMAGKKRCFEDEIGFTPYCAESWAYNARQTKQQCLGVCVDDYGFFNLLFHRYPGGNVSASGRLRPCLKCDEDLSGPGFKYSAGRTRRNSGIESAIPRADAEIYPVDHSAYFRSTSGVYGPGAHPRMRWGQVSGELCGGTISVVSLAQSGRSSRSLKDEGFFADLAGHIGAGNTELVRFGNNDEKIHRPQRYTALRTSGKTCLQKYVDPAREKCATPVLLTPAVRRKFEDAIPVPAHGEYQGAMREPAAAMGVNRHGKGDMTRTALFKTRNTAVETGR